MIFVSYSDPDQALVEALVIDLGLLGQNVYFEEKSLGGSPRWDEIFESIEQSDAFVYTITATTRISLSRLLEYEHALALGKPILPLRLEDVDVWALPPGLPAIIDYQPQNEAVRAELARVLTTIPPTAQSATSIARPELAFALGQLYRRIHTPYNSPAENAAILLNLREFLERRETYTAAELMLNDFAGRIASTGALADAVRRLRSQLKRVQRPKSFLSRGRALKGLLLLAVAVAMFSLLRAAPVSPILGDPAAVTEDMTITPTGVAVNLPVDLTAEVLAGLAQSTATYRLTSANPGGVRVTATVSLPTQAPTQLPPTQPPQAPPTQSPPTQPPTQSLPTQPPPPRQPPPMQAPPTHQPRPSHQPPRGLGGGHGNENHGDRHRRGQSGNVHV